MEQAIRRRKRGGKHRGEAQWRALLDLFPASGLTMYAFCDREGISKESFRRWRRHFGYPAPTSAASAPAVQVSGIPAAEFVDLGDLRVQSSAAAAALELTLDLGGGIVLHLVRR
jgi:hypothetical protein